MGAGRAVAGLEMKPILDVLDELPLFPESMIAFFRWAADYYIHPLGEVIKCALPGGLNRRDRTVAALTEDGRRALSGTGSRSRPYRDVARDPGSPREGAAPRCARLRRGWRRSPPR